MKGDTWVYAPEVGSTQSVLDRKEGRDEPTGILKIKGNYETRATYVVFIITFEPTSKVATSLQNTVMPAITTILCMPFKGSGNSDILAHSLWWFLHGQIPSPSSASIVWEAMFERKEPAQIKIKAARKRVISMPVWPMVKSWAILISLWNLCSPGLRDTVLSQRKTCAHLGDGMRSRIKMKDRLPATWTWKLPTI